ncbi:MAG: hypothetical protein HOV79_09005 [Hamadaea sp.]|nr:hypothetical protein [Hamadaea sp.]
MQLAALLTVMTVYFAAKAVAVARGPAPHGVDLALFLTIWPGMRTGPFARRTAPADDRRLIRRGALVGGCGIAAWITLSRLPLTDEITGWLGVAVVLTTFHLGLADVITGGLRMRGHAVRRLFDDPLLSTTLRGFWSHRWNLAFVEMNQVVFLPWLRPVFGRHAIAAAFVLSGLLHELAISLPVGAGFGLPTLYFCLHAAAVSVETRLRVHRWPVTWARLWTWAWLIVPLPLLFHRAFRDALVLPLFGGLS